MLNWLRKRLASAKNKSVERGGNVACAPSPESVAKPGFVKEDDVECPIEEGSGREESRLQQDEAALYTRPATWEDVLVLTTLLEHYQVRYILVGGYALAAHGHLRMTQDIDIAVDPDPKNSACWIAALANLSDGVTSTMKGEYDPFEGDYLHAIRINDEFTVDLLPSVAGISYEELEQYAINMELEEGPIKVLNLEGILRTKQGVRPKDIADRQLIERVLARLGTR